jgi:hypothetical protein
MLSLLLKCFFKVDNLAKFSLAAIRERGGVAWLEHSLELIFKNFRTLHRGTLPDNTGEDSRNLMELLSAV